MEENLLLKAAKTFDDNARLRQELVEARAENERLRKFVVALEGFANVYAKGFMPGEASEVAGAICARARKELEALDETP